MAAAPSTNIFASRETEMLLRSLSLRRLSYAVFTGERNQFLAQLPVIQERLVDVLRPGVVAPVVHSEVYLCMRVLLCRLSPHNLSSFWPVILTELVGRSVVIRRLFAEPFCALASFESFSRRLRLHHQTSQMNCNLCCRPANSSIFS
jgi:hypothetical protein